MRALWQGSLGRKGPEERQQHALKGSPDSVSDHRDFEPLRQLSPVRKHVNIGRSNRQGQREQPPSCRLLQTQLGADPEPTESQTDASREFRYAGPLHVKARRAGEVPKAPRSLPRVNVAELAQKREVGNACRREHQAEQGGPGELPYGVPAGRQGRLERSEASEQGERSGAEAAENCCKNRGL